MMDARHTPHRSEELRGELEAPTSRSADDLGGGHSAPAEARREGEEGFARSPWAKVVGKSAAFFAGMLGLAAIGAWSQMAGAGVPVPMPPRPSADAHGVWLAGSAVPPTPSAPPSAPSSSSPAPAPEPASAGTAPGGVTPDGRVILNTATVDDLQKLPRVGRKRAEAIVELRKKLGKFRKATELLRVRGIGPKGLRLMLPKLVVDPPAA